MLLKRLTALVTALMMVAASACGETLEERIARLEWQSNRSEAVHGQSERRQRLDLEGFEPLLENDAMTVYFRSETCGIRVENRQTGYIWGGLAADKPDNMNKKWSAVGNSLAWLTYYTLEGAEKTTAITPGTHQVTCTRISAQEAVLHLDFTDIGLTFDLVLALNPEGFSITLPDASISETGENRLGWVCLNPFFGTVPLTEALEGYMLLPDGCGALMRFNQDGAPAGSFEKRIYGRDYASDLLYSLSDISANRPNAFATEEEQLLMPVYGMVHGEDCDAYLARVTEGAAYASICAVPGGVVTDYAYICAKFVYRQKFSQPVSRSGAGIQVVQSQRNSFDAQVRWTLLGDKDANYSGMARTYREQLLTEGLLAPSQPVAEDIPLQVDFLMSGIEQGFLFNQTYTFSTLEDIVACLQQLDAPVALTLLGWQCGGIDGNRLSDVSLPGKLGGTKTDTALEQLKALCRSVCLGADPVWGYETQLDRNSEAIQTLSQTVAEVTVDSSGEWLGKQLLVRPGLASERVQALARNATPVDGLLLQSFSHDLYADQNRTSSITRDQAIELAQDALRSAGEEGLLMLAQPNDYAFAYMDAFTDTPVFNSQLLYETDTVPFLQLVLRGSVPLFAPYANECFYSDRDVLRMIDYGVYPSFLFTGSNNALMRHTTQADLTSTCYTDWMESAREIYARVNAVLGPVSGCAMLRREVLPSGVSLSYYENGLVVAVNHLSSPARALGKVIAAQSACVIEVQQ